MPDINKAFPSKYLKASDLGDAQPVVTIDRVEFEAVGQDKEMKACLYFRGKEKGIVLNRTNANKIIQLTGSAITEDWTGHRIKLYASETSFRGETVECIRVKAASNGAPSKSPLPKPKPAPVVDEHDDFSGDAVEDDDSVPF